jgi:hypothetical protein
VSGQESSRIPKDVKRLWARLDHRTRGRLHKQWTAAQAERRALGDFKHAQHLEHLRQLAGMPQSIADGLTQ